ncbi:MULTISPECIES: sodium:alanine symporter family protein [unclassified Streptococcus]|uniref:alanine/glycine:cation symporter family protein n=1 Tax=unclassified Streptococcus TaxID=2608887 RepID=UPI0018AAE3AF|nr:MULTISPECIES: sodium:alanine symporter family protein [unclassified Streptococcus]MBF8971016.1 sodium:alanine symporter family protein [Streptococcus sp. NLN76]MBG9368255.1 sodium:alanine symporter family protein [Streptococcus sp. NLN64]MBJ6745996.1 sodium:alanine symporter family protein [Streptococcus sp. 121]
MLEFLTQLDAFVWGPPLLILLVGTGIFLSFRLGMLQVTQLPRALKLIFKADDKEGTGDISSFAALSTALAATIGTGNIVGVATAIKMGGPGALFWMWVAAFFGMATKYAEGVLAIRYRVKDEKGAASGGPMYYIVNGMGEKWRPLANFFAGGAVLTALLSTGTFTQVSSITDSIKTGLGIGSEVTGPILTILVAIAIFGGIQSISKISTAVVPFMALVYVLAAGTILVVNIDQLLPTLELVVTSAFTPAAALGGFAGATVRTAIQTGIARGVFSNESGMGSAPIAAAAAKTESPVEQGLISMTGTFIDTIIVCSLTGLSILITGVWTGEANGASLTQAAFGTVFGNLGAVLLMLFLVLFAFTTIIGWNYYGERCFEFLFGLRFIWIYRALYVAFVFLGAFLTVDVIWLIADIVNALMVLPNLIALLALSPIVVMETKKYLDKQKKA